MQIQHQEELIQWSKNTHGDKAIAQSLVISLTDRPIKLPKEAALQLEDHEKLRFLDEQK